MTGVLGCSGKGGLMGGRCVVFLSLLFFIQFVRIDHPLLFFSRLIRLTHL